MTIKYTFPLSTSLYLMSDSYVSGYWDATYLYYGLIDFEELLSGPPVTHYAEWREYAKQHD